MPRPRRTSAERKAYADKQEKRTARDLQGRVQPGSGSVPVRGLREDVKSAEVLVQCKTTEKGSFSIKKKEFDLTTERALEEAKMPCWRIEIQSSTDVAVIRWEDYVQLLRDAGML